MQYWPRQIANYLRRNAIDINANVRIIAYVQQKFVFQALHLNEAEMRKSAPKYIGRGSINEAQVDPMTICILLGVCRNPCFQSVAVPKPMQFLHGWGLIHAMLTISAAATIFPSGHEKQGEQDGDFEIPHMSQKLIALMAD